MEAWSAHSSGARTTRYLWINESRDIRSEANCSGIESTDDEGGDDPLLLLRHNEPWRTVRECFLGKLVCGSIQGSIAP